MAGIGLELNTAVFWDQRDFSHCCVGPSSWEHGGLFAIPSSSPPCPSPWPHPQRAGWWGRLRLTAVPSHHDIYHPNETWHKKSPFLWEDDKTHLTFPLRRPQVPLGPSESWWRPSRRADSSYMGYADAGLPLHVKRHFCPVICKSSDKWNFPNSVGRKHLISSYSHREEHQRLW